MQKSEAPEVSQYVGTKPDNVQKKKEDKHDASRESSIATPVMAVFAILIVIVLIYYTTTCFGASKKPKIKKKGVEEADTGGFDIYAEVEKLRKKQDEYKERI